LGEGINDAPALKSSDVALVVAGASDIARETADVILLNKSLNVILDGIEEGREVFANTIKYVKMTLASNFGNFYAVAIATLLIPFLPMLPIQILLVNLLSDFPLIAIATDSVDPEEVKNPEGYNLREFALVATLLGLVSSVFDFIFFGLFYRTSPQVLQTNWFIGSILTELVLLYSLRTRLPFYRTHFPSLTILILTLLAAIATVAIPFTSVGISLFRFTPPSGVHLRMILAIVILYFAATEATKLAYYRIFGSKTKIGKG
jgi:Mg2+-importing ATPase